MQELLENCFGLQMYRETREVAVDASTAASGGSKLKPTGKGSCKALNTLDSTRSLKRPGVTPPCVIPPPLRQESKWVWDVHGVSLKVLASLLRLDCPVIRGRGCLEPVMSTWSGGEAAGHPWTAACPPILWAARSSRQPGSNRACGSSRARGRWNSS